MGRPNYRSFGTSSRLTPPVIQVQPADSKGKNSNEKMRGKCAETPHTVAGNNTAVNSNQKLNLTTMFVGGG
jgi:hypothetical protein